MTNEADGRWCTKCCMVDVCIAICTTCTMGRQDQVADNEGFCLDSVRELLLTICGVKNLSCMCKNVT